MTLNHDGKAPALEVWSNPSLLLFPGPLWSGVVAPDWVLSMGQVEKTGCKKMMLNCNCYIAIHETI